MDASGSSEFASGGETETSTSASTSAASGRLAVSYTTRDGSALAGVDYVHRKGMSAESPDFVTLHLRIRLERHPSLNFSLQNAQLVVRDSSKLPDL